MLRRGLGRLGRRLPLGSATGRAGLAPTVARATELLEAGAGQPVRGFRHHEGGWWEDQDEGGIVEAQPVERNPAAFKSILSYVSDARKEEIYRLHKLDPQIYDAAVLSYLFNLSRVRVEAILKLKQSEVDSRLQGLLYTEEDDEAISQAAAAGASSAAGAGPGRRGKRGVRRPAPSPAPSGDLASVDPSELLLVDDETGAEALEDLTRPPGAPPRASPELLRVHAAVQQLRLAARLAGPEATEQELEEAAASLLPMEGGGPDEAFLEELSSKLEEAAVAAKAAAEEQLDQPYELKPMDEAPDPVNGFRMLARREAAMLGDPLFLEYHVFMALEKERLELVLAHLRATHDRRGGAHAVTPYEQQELHLAGAAYARKKQRAMELLAKLKPLLEARAAEQDETKAADLAKEEKALLRTIRSELPVRVVLPEELAAAAAEVHAELAGVEAHDRRGRLVLGLQAQDPQERRARLAAYLGMLRAKARQDLDVSEAGSRFDDVRFEALLQHRRVVRRGDAYAKVGGPEAHAALEQALIDVLDALPEAEAAAAPRPEGGAAALQAQDERLAQLLSAQGRGPEARAAAAKAYALSLLAEFSWEDEAAGEARDAELARRAYQTLMEDLHESTVGHRVAPDDVAAELQALLAPEGADATAAGAEKEEERGVALLRTALVRGGATAAAVPHGELREKEFEYSAAMEAELLELRDARVGALRRAVAEGPEPGAKSPQALRRYALLLGVSADLEAHDRQCQEVLGRALPGLLRAFRGKAETVAAAYGAVVQAVYGGQQVGGEPVAEVARLAGRTEVWVEATLRRQVDEAQRQASGACPVDDTAFYAAARGLSLDCFEAGIRSGPALRRLREELQAVLGGDGGDPAEAEAVAAEAELPVNAERTAALLGKVLQEPIGGVAEEGEEVYDVLRGRGRGKATIEDRARAARALLEHLRMDEAYLEYVGRVKDTVVEEIEEEMLDTIHEYSEELRAPLDPNLVDLKPREHYDVPSLRFRVLKDDEVAVSEHPRDGFLSDEAAAGAGGPNAWRPRDPIRDHQKAAATATSAGAKQQRRWSFAFKDTAIAEAGPQGATVVRDSQTGRLRAASKKEEGARSWTQRKRKIRINQHA